MGLVVRRLRPLWEGIAIYAASGLFVLLGVCWGVYLLVPFNGGQSIQRVPDAGSPYLEATTRWDAQWYLRIAAEGYFYTPEAESSVAFFPVYPLLVRGVYRLTGLPASVAGLLVS
ncbi:MAG: mannosyltransferase family protein, partial [Thermoguttaceae bacterium]